PAYLARILVRLRSLVIRHLRSSANQPTRVPRSCLPSSQISEGHTASPLAFWTVDRYCSRLPDDSSTLVAVDLSRPSRRTPHGTDPLQCWARPLSLRRPAGRRPCGEPHSTLPPCR